MARLRRVLQFEPYEARRLGVLENPEQCRDLKKLWLCVAEFQGADEFDGERVCIRPFDFMTASDFWLRPRHHCSVAARFATGCPCTTDPELSSEP